MPRYWTVCQCGHIAQDHNQLMPFGAWGCDRTGCNCTDCTSELRPEHERPKHPLQVPKTHVPPPL